MTDSKGQFSQLDINGGCTIYGAAERHVQTRSAIQQSIFVHLDLSGITNIDASFLQVLVAAIIEADSLCMEQPIQTQSTSVRNPTEKLHLKALFGDAPLAKQLEEDGYVH